MGFTKPDLPKVDPDTFMQQPLMHRMKVLALHWVERGFGTPRMVHVIYILKLLTFYILGGVVIATATSHLPAFWHVAQWWNQPIVYEKAVLWTVLLETVGVAGSWGPLAGKFKPMTGGILFWARTGTIRLRPWKRVPLTAGDRRTPADVALYLALIVSVIVPLVASGRAQRLAVRRGARQHLRRGQPGAHRPGDRAARAQRAAGQDHLPGRARRAVPARPGVLHRAAVHRHDHRAQAADRHGLGRRRLLQARQALRQRGAAHGQQQPRRAVPVDQAGALPRLPPRHPPVPARPPDGARRRHASSRSSPR